MFFLHEKDSKTKSHPIRLQGVGVVTALTPALAGPQVDTLGIEFHEEHVIAAHVAVPIQGALREACDPGIAHGVNLRQLASIRPNSQLMSAACATVSGHDRETQWTRMKTTQLR